MNTMTDLEQKVVVRQEIAKLLEFFNEAETKHYAERYAMLEPETYEAVGGTKYIKIAKGPNGHMRTVHCFVHALTGDVYMPAGWNKPSLNGARYNILDADSLDHLKTKWDSCGGYLYKR